MINFPHFSRLQEPNCTAKAKRPKIVSRNFSPRIYGGTPFYGHPLNTDTRFIWTLSFVPTKSSYIFSKLALFIRTPVNTDNGHFSGSRVTNSHILSTPLYGHWLSAHCHFQCHNYVIIVDILPCSNNDRFLRVNKILLQYPKKTQ